MQKYIGDPSNLVRFSGMPQNLKPTNYVLWQDGGGTFHLSEQPKFELPSKIYNNPENLINRVLKYFNEKKKSVGLVLQGKKGNGKTLTAKKLCAESGLPVIIINNCFTGDAFNYYISTFNQPVCLLFDEFEKVYDGHQEELLTLLDGSISHNCIFVFTANRDVSYYFENRLTRIRYKFNSDNIDREVLNEIIDDILINKNHLDDFDKVFDYIPDINIDSLIGLIDEVNRNDESPIESIKFLNLVPEGCKYEVKLTYHGEDINIDSKTFNGILLMNNYQIYLTDNKIYIDDDDDNAPKEKYVDLYKYHRKVIKLKDTKYKKINRDDYVFELEPEILLHFTKKPIYAGFSTLEL